MKIERHSPSSLNLFAAQPAMFTLERLLGKRQPVGAAAHRGTAVEAGVAAGLLDPDKSVDDCAQVALAKFDSLMALVNDPRREDTRAGIPGMVALALDELRPYGVPTSLQGFVEWKPDGLEYPIVGFYDFCWESHGIIVDLKTTGSMPSSIKTGHARQVALYASRTNNVDARLTYVTPKKRVTYGLENIDAHLKALHRIALAVEKFISLSDDPEFFVSITAPDVDSFYWTPPSARQLAFDTWGC